MSGHLKLIMAYAYGSINEFLLIYNDYIIHYSPLFLLPINSPRTQG
jgi:hypothetical protein